MRSAVPGVLRVVLVAACAGEATPPTVDDLVAFQASGATRTLRAEQSPSRRASLR
jgi:hypothetical protein